MSEIKVIMSFNIHSHKSHKSHKPRTIPKRWRLWIELLKAFPSGFAKQQSWRCEVFAAVMFHAASDAFSASPPLHLVNCKLFFSRSFPAPYDMKQETPWKKRHWQSIKWGHGKPSQYSSGASAGSEQPTSQLEDVFGVSATWSFGKPHVSTSFSICWSFEWFKMKTWGLTVARDSVIWYLQVLYHVYHSRI